MTNDLRNHAADILAGMPIYLIEALERKVRDRAEFDSLLYGLLEYLSKRIE